MTTPGDRRVYTLLSSVTILALLLILPLGDGLQNNLEMFIAQSLVSGLAILMILRLRAGPLGFDFTHVEVLIILYLAVCFVSLTRADYRYAALLRFGVIASGSVVYVAVRDLLARESNAAARLRRALSISATIAVAYAIIHSIATGDRAHGFFEDPNGLAAFANVGLAVLICGEVRADERPWPRNLGAVRLIASTVMLLGIILAQSRGGLLGALVVLGMASVRMKRTRLFFVAALLMGAIALATPVREKLLPRSPNDVFAWQRVDIFKMDLEMVVDHPLTGVGLGQFPWYAPQYNFPLDTQPVRYSKIALAAHSDLLQALAELGAPGGFVLLALMLCPLFALATAKVTDELYAVCMALVAMSFQGLFHHLLLTHGLLLLWFTLLAMLHPGAAERLIAVPAGRWRALVGTGAVLFLWAGGVYVPFEAAREAGIAAAASENLPVAQSAIRRSVRLLPIQPYYRQAMADQYAHYYTATGNLGALALAVENLEAAAMLNPNDWTFARRLAALYARAIERGLNTEESVRALRGALERELDTNPKWPVSLVELARIDIRQSRRENAERKLREALSLEPNYIRAHYELRRLLKARSDWEAYDAETARIRELIRKYSRYSTDENPYVREILAITKEMKLEFL